MAHRPEHVLGADQLGKLIEALARKGYEVIGPTVRDGAIAEVWIFEGDQYAVDELAARS